MAPVTDMYWPISVLFLAILGFGLCMSSQARVQRRWRWIDVGASCLATMLALIVAVLVATRVNSEHARPSPTTGCRESREQELFLTKSMDLGVR
jgi:hypothetical protein